MGCNSHITIEVRDDRYPAIGWQCWAIDVMEGRNYGLYAAMAGVRGDGPEPKGMPHDIDDDSKDFHDNNSDHSVTWLTPEEYYKAYSNCAKSREWEAIYRCLFMLEDIFGIGNVRMIIGFDK